MYLLWAHGVDNLFTWWCLTILKEHCAQLEIGHLHGIVCTLRVAQILHTEILSRNGSGNIRPDCVGHIIEVKHKGHWRNIFRMLLF